MAQKEHSYPKPRLPSPTPEDDWECLDMGNERKFRAPKVREGRVPRPLDFPIRNIGNPKVKSVTNKEKKSTGDNTSKNSDDDKKPESIRSQQRGGRQKRKSNRLLKKSRKRRKSRRYKKTKKSKKSRR